MKVKNIFMKLLFIFVCAICVANAGPVKSSSVYQTRLNDADAVYFSPENFNIKADGKTDVSDALQEAINTVKTKYNFGIVFIPEGTYLITKTIYIPTAIRLIGYGEKRPLIVLAKNSPGFQAADTTDKGLAKYMFWFISGYGRDGQGIRDATPSTFYSAMSNIDLKISDGNPHAIALRTHYAQHGFISHVDIHIGKGKAGIFDVGNEIENVRFFNGEYGIITTKPSPGWQFMMVDNYFEGQRRAAIRTQQAGLTIVRMNVKNVPTVIDINDTMHEKLFMEDCRFDNVSGPAIIVSNEYNAHTQISLRNIDCNKVPLFVSYGESGRQRKVEWKTYKVCNYVYGLQFDDLGSEPSIKTIEKIEELKSFPAAVESDIPQIPSTRTWVNIKSLGAKGDGETDDTKIIQNAIANYTNIYFPQGWYRVTETISLKSNTVLIGLSPIATQLILKDNTEAFGGFGGPKALLEVPKGGTNIVSGIGLSTGSYNSRAVACKWMAGEKSYMNDVKFVGGHGGMRRPQPQTNDDRPRGIRPTQPSTDPAWDTQYWSLWITNGGGGVFKDIWTASTYATSGAYISNTSTQGRIYAMSVEHHVRNEIRFKNVSNWKVYALQLEEEGIESAYCQPLEVESCSNLLFANLYIYRVSRMTNTIPYAVRTWNCKEIEFLNVHNFAKVKFAADNSLYDINTDIEIRPWEFTRLYISGSTPRKELLSNETGKIQQLVKGFEFAEGICKDSKGNIFFSESKWRRIYKWSIETNTLSMIGDYPWEPLALACDKNDQLMVLFKYIPRPGYLVNGIQERFELPHDASLTSTFGWNQFGFDLRVYSIDPNRPDETIQLLKKEPMGSVKNIYKALYPGNRWRDHNNFKDVLVTKAEECFVAQDAVTIIPVSFDLSRAISLIEAFPGKELFMPDEYDKRTVKLTVNGDGSLSNFRRFVEKGEFSSTTDANGNLYVADGEIYVFDKSGKQIDEIKLPERPTTIIFGGKDGKTLFITTRTSLYSMNVKNY